MKRVVQARDTFVRDPGVMCSCGNHALHFLELHAVGECTPEVPTVSGFRCNPCLARDVERVQEMVDEDVWCVSCGLTIVSLSDMIVRQCPIGER